MSRIPSRSYFFEDFRILTKRHPLVSSENLKKRNFLGHSKDDTFEVFKLPQIAERWHLYEPSLMPLGIPIFYFDLKVLKNFKEIFGNFN